MATDRISESQDGVKSDTLLALIDLLKDLTRDEKRRVLDAAYVWFQLEYK